MDPGESAAECCAREVLEETGLAVLVGVYSTPHRIVEYADGNRRQGVTLSFEAEPIGGELCITDETTEVGYFSPEQMKSMDVMDPVCERVADALAGQRRHLSVSGAAIGRLSPWVRLMRHMLIYQPVPLLRRPPRVSRPVCMAKSSLLLG